MRDAHLRFFVQIFFAVFVVLSHGLLYADGSGKIRLVNAGTTASLLAAIIDGTTQTSAARFKAAVEINVDATTHQVVLIDAATSNAVATPLAVYAGPAESVTLVATTSATGTSTTTHELIFVPSLKGLIPEGKAHATFMLAANSLDEVDVFAGWFKIVKGLKRGTYKGPNAIPAGSYNVTAKAGDEVVLGPLELKPEAGKAYTIVAFSNPSGRITHEIYVDQASPSNGAAR